LEAVFNPFRRIVNQSPQSPNPVIRPAAQMRDGHNPKSVWLFEIDNSEGKPFCLPTPGSELADLAELRIALNLRQDRFRNGKKSLS